MNLSAVLTRKRSWSVQTAWGVGGLMVLIVVTAVSLTNLQDIYEAQKDFVVGSLLSLVGFCFAKAISRRPEDEAIELVSTSPDPALRKAVIARVAHDEGVLRELSVLARDVDAAGARLSQYFDLRTRTLEFHKDAALLFVAIEDLDQAAERTNEVRALLGADDLERYPGDLASGGRLTYIRRYLREAANRRDQLYDHLSAKVNWEAQRQVADTFSVMSADIWKAGRALNRVLGRHVVESPEECLRLVTGYVYASRKRGEKLMAALEEADTEVPIVFGVLMDDLQQAEVGLRQQLGLKQAVEGDEVAPEAAAPDRPEATLASAS